MRMRDVVGDDMKRLLTFSLIGILGVAAIIAIGPDQSDALQNEFVRLMTCGIALIVVVFLSMLSQWMFKGGHR